MVNDTMITVNLGLLAITLAVLVCALAIALRVLWEYRCMHKATLRELHEALDERDAYINVVGWVDMNFPHTFTAPDWVDTYSRVKSRYLK